MHTFFTRYRLDHNLDRHNIKNPLGLGKHDMDIWANTLLKTRVATLFTTVQGTRGHAMQIQNELNRLNAVKTKHLARAIHVSKLIRRSLQKAKKVALANGFPAKYVWQLYH